jgi:hypothetical protein
VLIAVAVAAVGYEIVSVIAGSFTPGPGGATSSSFATSSDGLAAYAELLQRTGHRVTQLRGVPADAHLDPSQTVVALDPNRLSNDDVRALKGFVQTGGELVAGGVNPGRWLGILLADPPKWSTSGVPDSAPLGHANESQGVSKVRSAGNGSFTSSGQTTPVLAGPGGSLMTVAQLGSGRIALLADASPLQNAYIAQADDAGLGVRIAGAPGRAVTFLEGIHGYGTSTGLAALPTRWKWTLVGLLAAAAVAVAARFRRLGDPEPPPSSPVPPRRAHVEALAVALQRTHRPRAATAPVRAQARELIIKRAALPPDPDEDAIITAARTLGLDDAEARAVAGGAQSDAEGDLLAAGRALAMLYRGGS